MASRIQWSDFERESVLTRALRQWEQDGMPPDWTKAQEVLPQDRRQVRPTTRAYHEHRLTVEFRARTMNRPRPPVTPAPVPPVEQLSTVESLLASSLAKAFIEAITVSVVAEIRDMLADAAEAQQQTKQVVEDAPPKERLERLVIVGVNKHYEEQLRQELASEPFDVRYVRYGTPMPFVQQRVSYADRVVLVTNWLAHKVDDAVKANKPSGCTITRVTGGVPAILQAIRNGR